MTDRPKAVFDQPASKCSRNFSLLIGAASLPQGEFSASDYNTGSKRQAEGRPAGEKSHLYTVIGNPTPISTIEKRDTTAV